MNWILEASLCDKKGEKDKALDIIFDNVDEAFRAGRFDSIDFLLKDAQFDTDKLSINLSLGWLTATLPAKSKLPNRKQFFDAVKKSMEARGEMTSTLLAGLE